MSWTPPPSQPDSPDSQPKTWTPRVVAGGRPAHIAPAIDLRVPSSRIALDEALAIAASLALHQAAIPAQATEYVREAHHLVS